jgi:hypothetical protein
MRPPIRYTLLEHVLTGQSYSLSLEHKSPENEQFRNYIERIDIQS